MTILSHNRAIFRFDHAMNITDIRLNDISVSVSSSGYISTSWLASYINDTALEINVSYGSLFKGDGTLNVRITSYRAIRASTGGCVSPRSFDTSLQGSLQSSADSARSITNFTGYIVLVRILIGFGILMI